ncbi:MAG: hypothetical protein IH782_11835 [candidate division NC10 bacterium]|nr:hypothetical protein [candidate division NC10 bacterium]
MLCAPKGSWYRAAGLGLKLADRIPVPIVLYGWRELSDAKHHPPIQIHPRQNEIAHLKVTEVHRPGDPEAAMVMPEMQKAISGLRFLLAAIKGKQEELDGSAGSSSVSWVERRTTPYREETRWRLR